jgi:2-C-methyl-D-erythritol 2,4-cyclodiphosphate synthase
MCGNIASDLNIVPTAVNVKGTTTEKMGFLGRGDGIASEAVCLLESNGPQ